MPLFTPTQQQTLDDLVQNVPGLRKGQTADPDIDLGTKLESLVIPLVTSPDGSDAGTVQTLVNEIKAILNALPKP